MNIIVALQRFKRKIHKKLTRIVYKYLPKQARAAAVYVSLKKAGLLNKALKDNRSFLEIVYGDGNTDEVKNGMHLIFLINYN